MDLKFAPGGEHRFDVSATLHMPWMKEGLSKVTELWLGGDKIEE